MAKRKGPKLYGPRVEEQMQVVQGELMRRGLAKQYIGVWLDTKLRQRVIRTNQVVGLADLEFFELQSKDEEGNVTGRYLAVVYKGEDPDLETMQKEIQQSLVRLVEEKIKKEGSTVMQIPVFPAMLAQEKDPDKLGLWDDPMWVLQAKFDGDRILAYIGEHGIRLFAGRPAKKAQAQTEKTALVPWISNIKLPEYAGTWIDGEMIHKDGFQRVRSIMGSKDPKRAVELQKEFGYVKYVVFDCPYFKGQDIRDLAYIDRLRHALEVASAIELAILAEYGISGIVEQVATVQENKKQAYLDYVSRGGEGVMLKHRHGKYEPGKRSHQMVKVKATAEEDVIIVGFEPPEEFYREAKTGLRQIEGYRKPDGEEVRLMSEEPVYENELEKWVPEGCEPIFRRTALFEQGLIGAVKFGQFVPVDVAEALKMTRLENIGHLDGHMVYDDFPYVLVEVGRCSGMTMELRKAMSENPEEFLGRVAVLKVYPVDGMTRFPDTGMFRMPQFKGLRDDKPAEECVWHGFKS